jgi:DNA-binding NarL/FixJ family response regulator
LSRFQPSSLRVVIVADEELVRRAMRQMLAVPDLHVVGEATDGESALDLIAQRVPDVVVIGLGSLEVSGVEATRRLSTVAPLSRVLVLTGADERDDVVDAILAGACGYLTKDSTGDEIVDAVRAAGAGQSVIDSTVAGQLLVQVRGQGNNGGPGDATRAELTERELDVLELLATGEESNQIADELFISPRAVQNHISSILAKLQLQSRIETAVHAVRGGVV